MLLDLPLASLAQDEIASAESLFREIGALGIERSEASLQLDLGEDAGRAAGVTLELFRRVFQAPDDFEIELTLDTGG